LYAGVWTLQSLRIFDDVLNLWCTGFTNLT